MYLNNPHLILMEQSYAIVKLNFIIIYNKLGLTK